VPKELNADEATYVLGAQANLWTEYITNPAKVEYMIFPRLTALSEVLWSPKEKRYWNDFEQRLQTQFKRYDLWQANYSRAYFDLKGEVRKSLNNKVGWFLLPKKKGSTIKITSPDNKAIYYSGDSIVHYFTGAGKYTAQQVAKKPLLKNQVVAAIGTALQVDFKPTKSTGATVALVNPPQPKYPGQSGAFSLVNGVYSNRGLSYPDWLGWIGDDLEATIDLGKTQSIDSVRMHTLNQNGSWIYLPQYVEVFASNDGKNFTSIGKSSAFFPDTLTMGWITVPVQKKSGQYIKVLAKNYGAIPDGQPGGGNKAWLFADEIQLY
jgi:hexosaminidase